MYICIFSVIKPKLPPTITKLESETTNRIACFSKSGSVLIDLFPVPHHEISLCLLVFGILYGIKSICPKLRKHDRLIKLVFHYLEHIAK